MMLRNNDAGPHSNITTESFHEKNYVTRIPRLMVNLLVFLTAAAKLPDIMHFAKKWSPLVCVKYRIS